LAPEGMDAIVFGKRDGEGDRKVPACSDDSLPCQQVVEIS